MTDHCVMMLRRDKRSALLQIGERTMIIGEIKPLAHIFLDRQRIDVAIDKLIEIRDEIDRQG